MATETLANLRTRARQRANMENSTFITDAELTSYINTSAQWLYDQLVEATGQHYNVTELTFTLTSLNNPYTLPSDFYQLVSVDVGPANSRVEVKPFQIHERNRTVGVMRYMLMNQTLRFEPLNAPSEAMRVFYVPAFTKLVLDADTLQGLNGWEEFVVVDAARKMLAKEESDTSVLSQELQVIFDRIERMKEKRDQGFSGSVQDSRKVFGLPDRYEELFIV